MSIPIPPLRIGLVDPTGNIKQGQESVSLGDMESLLGLNVALSSGANPSWADVNYNANQLLGVNNVAFAVDVLRAEPIVCRRTGSLNRLGFVVTTLGAAGSVVRIGLYRSLPSLYPDTLIADSGPLATDAGAGFRSMALNVPVNVGDVLWAVYLGGVSAPQVNAGGAFGQIIGSEPITGYSVAGGTGQPLTQLNVAFPFAALPATFPVGGVLNFGSAPILNYRYA